MSYLSHRDRKSEIRHALSGTLSMSAYKYCYKIKNI